MRRAWRVCEIHEEQGMNLEEIVPLPEGWMLDAGVNKLVCDIRRAAFVAGMREAAKVCEAQNEQTAGNESIAAAFARGWVDQCAAAIIRRAEEIAGKEPQ